MTIAPTNECNPLFPEGGEITAYCSSAVTGKTFVAISGDMTGKPYVSSGLGVGLVPDTASNLSTNIQVAPCAAGGLAFGIAGQDAATGGLVLLRRHHGGIYPVTASGSITAGDRIQVGSAGKAVTSSTGTGTKAAATTGVVGSNNALTYTANSAGDSGNALSIQILGSTGNSVSLSVAVNGDAIVVTPATNSGGTITSTATAVAAAIAASAAANSLVTVTNTSTSTGAGVVAAAGPTQLSGGVDAGTGYIVAQAVSSATDGNDVFVSFRQA